MNLKKTHSLCNMIFYSYFCVIDILIASGFQRSRSPKVLHHKWHQMQMCQALRLQQLKRSTFIFKLLFLIFFLLIVRLCHLEPFISLVNEAKQQGEITERVSTMPLYDMVVELLLGVGAWYVFVFLSLCVLIIPTEILNWLIISPVMACLLTWETWLLLVLASATTK